MRPKVVRKWFTNGPKSGQKLPKWNFRQEKYPILSGIQPHSLNFLSWVVIHHSFLTFQNLHRDIESHSQLIKTVLYQCGEIDALRRQQRKRLKENQRPAKQISVLLSVGKILEERWHCLWLRSLEWQCFLEQFTSSKQTSSGHARKKQVNRP